MRSRKLNPWVAPIAFAAALVLAGTMAFVVIAHADSAHRTVAAAGPLAAQEGARSLSPSPSLSAKGPSSRKATLPLAGSATSSAAQTGTAAALPPTATDSAAGGVVDVSKLTVPAADPNVNCAKVKCIALTFDDGPSATLTPKVLRILKAKKAVATFFVVGSMAKGNKSLLKREVAQGNVIGNHTWNHPDLATSSVGKIESQIARTSKLIERTTGQKVTLLRPPYGAVDSTVRKTAGLPFIMWSVDTRDWASHSATSVFHNVKKEASRGGIVLMHDIQAASVHALPKVINYLRGKGYTLVTIPTLLGNNLVDGHSYYER